MLRYAMFLIAVLGLNLWNSLAARAADATELDGTWQAVSNTEGGREEPKERFEHLRVTFAAGKLSIQEGDKGERKHEATFKVDATKTPKQLEFSPGNITIFAIYEIKGDMLSICFRQPGADKAAERPTEFASPADSKITLTVFKRVKP